MAKRIALLSVSDKTGVADFARVLVQCGFDLLSTGGTARHLRDAGLPVRDVSDATAFPEILDGRVKTLHPVVHAGLLARRDVDEHMGKLRDLAIDPIDVVVVNLYPFVETIRKPGIEFEEAVEQIDIGGPSMLRSAAKNFASVTVIIDSADYQRAGEQLLSKGNTTPQLRAELAAKVFVATSQYDAAIANYLSSHLAPATEGEFQWPAVYSLSLPLAQAMRYGENPHQAAAFYRDPTTNETSLATARQLHGKELSYNNILDAEGALEMVRDFADLAPAAAVIVKHSNPCGIAIASSPFEAYERARATDPDSAFGGIVALSAEVDGDTARAINATFNEIVIAPSFTGEALEILRTKKNLRLLETGRFTPKQSSKLVRGIVGGAVVTDRDLGSIQTKDLRAVTKTVPAAGDLEGLLFAWRCVKWVKSNAIVYASHQATLGIGAGQMSRVDAAHLGARKARVSLKGAYMASDAFFPFRDCVDIAHEHGIRAIIQPGGSMRDGEVIAAADDFGIAMVLTGMRHFRH
ncbi:bifunctional phosphoribosylaminoimidazolecarboxamide formyltransferase/IMP cyclohydrolase [Candidatus Sumerlaeota bacterium]|nr:bifunctional phosphoribosylaminoimidazolecarboxamide formyltransferase/IMP cyclohydrolase [Candidatus Sumerlaeota bacterium]